MLRIESKEAVLGTIYKSHLLTKIKHEYCYAGIGGIFII